MKVLVGCNEPLVTESIRALLTDVCQYGTSLKLIERESFAEVVQDASTLDCDLLILYGNCLSAPNLCSGGQLDNMAFAIKTIKTTRKLPTVVLNSMAEWREALRAAGADVCLPRPFDIGQFKDALAEVRV
jgi:DNA-binding NarL/FixJ family response regulator